VADDLGTILAVPVDHDPWAVPKPGQTVPQPQDPIMALREAAGNVVQQARPYWMDLDPTDREILERSNAMQQGITQPGKVLPTTGMNPVPFAALDIGSMLPVGGAAKLAAGVLGAGAKGALNAAAETGAEAAERAGIRAYHGSPHDFTQFDLSKIGTGEGAQAYGHGLYMAENEAVAKQYRDALSGKRKLVGDEPLNPNSVPHAVAELVDEHGGDIAAARNTLMKEVPTNDQERQMLTEALNLLNRGNIPKITPAPIKGHMYEVNIGAHPEQFLDWDKPLSEQPHIQSKLPRIATDTIGGRDVTGGQLVQKLGAPEVAHRILHEEAGIPGIRYLDQGSRAGPQFSVRTELRPDENLYHVQGPGGETHATFKTREEARALADAKSGEGQTSNYVVFDPKMIEIMRKYGIAGMLGGGAASQQQYPLPFQPEAR
jgi:hypothetical protein